MFAVWIRQTNPIIRRRARVVRKKAQRGSYGSLWLQRSYRRVTVLRDNVNAILGLFPPEKWPLQADYGIGMEHLNRKLNIRLLKTEELPLGHLCGDRGRGNGQQQHEQSNLPSWMRSYGAAFSPDEADRQRTPFEHNRRLYHCSCSSSTTSTSSRTAHAAVPPLRRPRVVGSDMLQCFGVRVGAVALVGEAQGGGFIRAGLRAGLRAVRAWAELVFLKRVGILAIILPAAKATVVALPRNPRSWTR